MAESFKFSDLIIYSVVSNELLLFDSCKGMIFVELFLRFVSFLSLSNSPRV